MERRDEATILRDHGIAPSAQRVAVARYVLRTNEHPSADEIWTRVKESFPFVSRATVYNTVKLFVEKGLLRQYALTEGRVVFDPKTDDHHHFIDVETGEIHDIPWEAIAIPSAPKLDGYDVIEYQVVMRGARKRRKKEK